jgi:hypothetical protein
MDGGVGQLTALAVFVGILGVLGGSMLYRYRVQRRQLASGRRLCAVRLLRDGSKLVATPRLSVARSGQLCRLVLAARITGEDEERSRPYRADILRARLPYTLTVSDRTGRVLYQESGFLDRFSMWFWTRSSGWKAWSRERSRWTDQGKAVILDFVPRQAGVHQVTLEIQARAEAQNQRSRSWCEALEAELFAAEGAEPFSRRVRRAYPHKTVEL